MVRTLQHKLVRDLWRLRYQCLTIALLVGCGIASFVAAVSAAASVQASRDAFYEDARFADVFAHLESRAATCARIACANCPASRRSRGASVGDYRVLIAGSDEAVVAHFVSVSGPEEARLNRTVIQSGRPVEPGSTDEIVLSATFAETWNLLPGSTLTAVINGRLAKLEDRRRRRLAGVRVGVRAADGAPDPWHFGVAWMDGDALAKAMGLVGRVQRRRDPARAWAPTSRRRSIASTRSWSLTGVSARWAAPISRRAGWSTRRSGSSRRQRGRSRSSSSGVAAFLLHVLLSRIVGTQREQIATLKALGYRTRELTAHYLEFALAICALGVVFGWGSACWRSKSISLVYARYFRFPSYLFRFDAWTIAVATCVAVAAGVGGTFSAVRKAVAIPPAEAMRPEAPPSYHHTPLDRVYELLAPSRAWSFATRARRPSRLLLSAASISLATAIVVAGERHGRFDGRSAPPPVRGLAPRRRSRSRWTNARPWRAVRDVAHIPGVRYAEGERQVPVRLRAGHRTRTTAILGIAEGMDLHRLLGADHQPLRLPPEGLSLSRPLGESLGRAGRGRDRRRGARRRPPQGACARSPRSSTTSSGSPRTWTRPSSRT